MFLFLFILLLAAIGYFDIARQGWAWYGLAYKTFYLVLAVLVGFRYGVGIDTITYMATFETMPTLGEMTVLTFVTYRFQPLFTITCIVCKTLWDNFLLLQLLQTFLFYHSLYLLFSLFKVRKFYLLLIFYSYMFFAPGMAAMRESFALAFCFYALYLYYTRQRVVWYYVLVIMGAFFHTGAVLFLIVPLFSLLRQNSIWQFALFCLSILVFASLASYVQEFIGDNVGGDGAIQRYKLDGSEAVTSLLTVVRACFALGVAFYICVLHPPKEKPLPVSFLYLSVCYILIDLLSGTLNPMLFRFSSHLCVFHLLFLKYIIEDKRVKEVLLVGVICCFYYQPLARMTFLLTDKGNFDYYSIFSPDKSFTKRRVATADTHDYILISIQ